MTYVNERDTSGRTVYYPVKLVKTFDLNKRIKLAYSKWAQAENDKERKANE
jgi:hypothetical protein